MSVGAAGGSLLRGRPSACRLASGHKGCHDFHIQRLHSRKATPPADPGSSLRSLLDYYHQTLSQNFLMVLLGNQRRGRDRFASTTMSSNIDYLPDDLYESGVGDHWETATKDVAFSTNYVQHLQTEAYSPCLTLHRLAHINPMNDTNSGVYRGLGKSSEGSSWAPQDGGLAVSNLASTNSKKRKTYRINVSIWYDGGNYWFAVSSDDGSTGPLAAKTAKKICYDGTSSYSRKGRSFVLKP
ncbi:hypothetical protein CIB48_g10225 [Xylaria polymorpha]|nr:hypothetical protein CIB48_g10225 [Xylaria polymorpha]